MIPLMSLGVACILLIGVVLLRERYWRKRFEIIERAYLKLKAQNERLVEYQLHKAMRRDD